MSPAHRADERPRWTASTWSRAQHVAVVLVFTGALALGITRLAALL